MSAREDPIAGEPVLVDREAARAILGVRETTFARLCREGRFENMVCAGGSTGRREFYRSVELRAYRAQDARRGASPRSVTNAAGEPSITAGVRVTSETKIAADARERPETVKSYLRALRRLSAAIFSAQGRHAIVLAEVSPAGASEGCSMCGLRAQAGENGRACRDALPSLREADYQGCRWIEGEPVPLRQGMFCRKPTIRGPWCAKHRGIVWRSAERARRRAA